MDPHEEKVAKLYIASIISVIVLAIMLGAIATVQESHFAGSLMTASIENANLPK